MTRRSNLQPVVPVLKDFDCVVHDPIDQWRPDSDEVWYWLTLHIGDPDSDAADLYYVAVFTPPGLTAAKQAGQSIGPPPPIVLPKYSWQAVLNVVNARLSLCEGFGWHDVNQKLRLKFAWEYENHN